MNFWNMEKEELLISFDSSEKGLSEKEAGIRLEKYGPNALKENKPKSILSIFLEQFKDFLIIILIVSAAVSISFGESKSAITIIMVLIVNAVLGVVQHQKAESSLKSLKKLSSQKSVVIRDGMKKVIDSENIVAGDMVALEAGDIVPADGRIIECKSLKVTESSLTGESTAVEKTSYPLSSKNPALADQTNMVFSGSLAVYGRAVFIATDTGMNTQIGRIASLLQNTTDKKTPLQERLDDFGKKLAFFIVAISVILFFVNLSRGYQAADSFMFAVALAVAAIPEALSSVVTIVMAIGTKRMAAKNAVVRKLSAVETLGAASVICSDKTGTLTQNKMSVVNTYIPSDNLSMIEKMCILVNDSFVSDDGDDIGDPTETALLRYAMKNNGADEIRALYPRVYELPFDSERKLMSTVHHSPDGEKLMLVKGAPDVLLKKCSFIHDENGISKLSEDICRNLHDINCGFADDGLRVLGFAYKNTDTDKIHHSDESGLIFAGLAAMIDPPREEVFAAVQKCEAAGITPIMITGDHKSTAAAIARTLGILDKDERAIDGIELDMMSDDELMENLESISVYARVSPEHKIRIVKAWQKKGKIVAMTGDGVNDAPSLKQADIGIAMGITGTQVSKDASAMVLSDDNFATIVDAVSEGRTVYNNIKRAIQFLLSGNTAGILAVIYCAAAGLPNPFTALHLLFINLATDSLPAIALAMEPQDSSNMNVPPRKKDDSIFAGGLGRTIFLQGSVIALVTIAAFYAGLRSDVKTAQTMAFSTLCLSRLLHGFNVRSYKSIFTIGISSNMYMVYAVMAGFALLVSVLYLPFGRYAFEVTSISPQHFLGVLGLSVIPVIITEIAKRFFKRTEKIKEKFNSASIIK